MKIDFMENRSHRYVMNVLKAALALLLAGALHAEEGIRILSADPADNVLLEISADTPRSVMASSDLKTWSYVFHYLPACQNFKAYAAQLQRKQTYYKLAPALPAFASVVLEPGIPVLEGKSFMNIGTHFSFSAGGVGTWNPEFLPTPENITYSIVDSRPGMISVRTVGADGHRLDHVILVATPGSLPNGRGALAYTANRFGDHRSYMWSSLIENAEELVPCFIQPEVPVHPVTWPTPEGMVFRWRNGTEVVSLGPDGIATITAGANSRTENYRYFATGRQRATVSFVQSDGTQSIVWIRGAADQVNHRPPGEEPYSLGYGEEVEVLVYPPISP